VSDQSSALRDFASPALFEGLAVVIYLSNGQIWLTSIAAICGALSLALIFEQRRQQNQLDKDVNSTLNHLHSDLSTVRDRLEQYADNAYSQQQLIDLLETEIGASDTNTTSHFWHLLPNIAQHLINHSEKHQLLLMGSLMTAWKMISNSHQEPQTSEKTHDIIISDSHLPVLYSCANSLKTIVESLTDTPITLLNSENWSASVNDELQIADDLTEVLAVLLLMMLDARATRPNIQMIWSSHYLQIGPVDLHDNPGLKQLLINKIGGFGWNLHENFIRIPGTDEHTQHQPRVLAVDDHSANLNLLKLQLQDLGLEVVTARHAGDALEKIKHQEFDILIFDINLPGISGPTLLKQIHMNYHQGYYSVALTATLSPEQTQTLIAAGFDSCLEKPATTAKLGELLKPYLQPVKRKPIRADKHQFRDRKIYDQERSIELANNNPAVADELLSILIETLPEDISQIETAMQHQDYAVLRRQVHKLKGACRYCIVPRLNQAVDQIEKALNEQPKQDLNSPVEYLRAEAKVLCKWFDIEYVAIRTNRETPTAER